MDITPTPIYEPAAANRNAFLLIRWLIIILASYLALFKNIEEPGFIAIFLVAVGFVLSNALIALAPLKAVVVAKQRRIVAAMDALFICTFLYFLRIEGVHVHLPFMGVVVLAIIWPDLRVVLFAMFAVSLLFGLITNLELFGATLEVARDDFLTLAMLFVVSIFYVFLVERFDQDAVMSSALLREKRHSEGVAEITRRIAASLESREILAILIRRFMELMPNVAASVIVVEPGSSEGTVVAGTPPTGSALFGLEHLPSLRTALTLKESSVATVTRNGLPLAALSVPMVSRDEVVAILHFEGPSEEAEAFDQHTPFLEIVARSAASALSNAEQFGKMKELATTDSMTRLGNHATFQARLAHEVERAFRHGRTVTLMMVDLDLLKEINDNHGHPMGDRVISAVAEAIRGSCREIDFAARYGGEEFALILPETVLPEGVRVADRLRAKIAAIDRFGVAISVSVGVASFPRDARTAEELVLAADNALYVAKAAGRNCVSPAPEDVTI